MPSRSTGVSELLFPGPERFEDLRGVGWDGEVQVLRLSDHYGQEPKDALQIVAELLASFLG
jgi:hypothetical protein